MAASTYPTTIPVSDTWRNDSGTYRYMRWRATNPTMAVCGGPK